MSNIFQFTFRTHFAIRVGDTPNRNSRKTLFLGRPEISGAIR